MTTTLRRRGPTRILGPRFCWILPRPLPPVTRPRWRGTARSIGTDFLSAGLSKNQSWGRMCGAPGGAFPAGTHPYLDDSLCRDRLCGGISWAGLFMSVVQSKLLQLGLHNGTAVSVFKRIIGARSFKGLARSSRRAVGFWSSTSFPGWEPGGHRSFRPSSFTGIAGAGIQTSACSFAVPSRVS